jgi:hypothetical protein
MVYLPTGFRYRVTKILESSACGMRSQVCRRGARSLVVIGWWFRSVNVNVAANAPAAATVVPAPAAQGSTLPVIAIEIPSPGQTFSQETGAQIIGYACTGQTDRRGWHKHSKPRRGATRRRSVGGRPRRITRPLGRLHPADFDRPTGHPAGPGGVGRDPDACRVRIVQVRRWRLMRASRWRLRALSAVDSPSRSAPE